MPIDEMLNNLRDMLEQFEQRPSDETLARVQLETMNIEYYCENTLTEE